MLYQMQLNLNVYILWVITLQIHIYDQLVLHMYPYDFNSQMANIMVALYIQFHTCIIIISRYAIIGPRGGGGGVS